MVKFEYDGKEYRIRNPILNNVIEVNQKALYGRTASGTLYRYNKGITHKRLELRWEDLTESEKDELLAAFVAIKTSQFTFTDHRNEKWMAVLLVDQIAFEEVSDETDADQSFWLDEQHVNSSVRKRSRYNCGIELEAYEA